MNTAIRKTLAAALALLLSLASVIGVCAAYFATPPAANATDARALYITSYSKIENISVRFQSADTLSVLSDAPAVVEVSDNAGVLVDSGSLTDGNSFALSFDMCSWPDGDYVLKVGGGASADIAFGITSQSMGIGGGLVEYCPICGADSTAMASDSKYYTRADAVAGGLPVPSGGSSWKLCPDCYDKLESGSVDETIYTKPAPSVSASSISMSSAGDATVEYKIYKLFDADVADGMASNIAYASDEVAQIIPKAAVMSALVSGSPVYDHAQEAAQYVADNMAAGFVDAGSLGYWLASFAASDLTAVATVTSGGSADVPGPGYYLVADPDIVPMEENSVASSPVFVLVGENNTEITEKIAVPTVEKFVKEDSTGEYAKIADATLSQSLDFRLVGTLPANLAAYGKYAYTFHDHNGGALGAPIGLKVFVDDVLVDASKYAVNMTDEGFDVVFADLLSCGVDVSASSRVVVEYSAVMLPFDLSDYAPIACDGYAAEIEYSNNPMNAASVGATTTAEVSLFYYGLTFSVVDKVTRAPLAGVGFTVKNSTGAYIGLVDGGLSEVADPYTWTTTDSGTLAIFGLDADTYTISEVSPLPDYLPLESDFVVSLSSDYTEITTELVSAPDLVTISEDGITVANDKTVSLPVTGEITHMLITLAGAAVIAFALWQMRRTRRED